MERKGTRSIPVISRRKALGTPMDSLHFDQQHLTKRWQHAKAQFRMIFWDDIHAQVKNQVKSLIQNLIQAEFDFQLGANTYQRSNARRSKRNGFYLRSLETSSGRISDLKIPRARNLDIRFSIFDKWQQVSDSVIQSMLEAYLLSRSASCAQTIIQAFGNSRFSRGFLQRLTRRFEKNLQTWQNRPITKAWPYLFIDGMAVRLRESELSGWCVLWALGMDESRNTEVLGFIIVKSESQEGVERLLRDLKDRGLKPPKLITSDDSRAIENGAAMVFPHVTQQGCTFHKIKAAGNHVSDRKNKKQFLRQASAVYATATGKRSIYNNLENFKQTWKTKEPHALRSFLSGFDRTTTYLNFPKEHWKWIRTDNPMERFIEEVRRWTGRFGYFQGRGNLAIALFSFLAHNNKNLVPSLTVSLPTQKDTISIA